MALLWAFWEDRGRGLGVMRIGPKAHRPGDPYEQMIAVDSEPGPHPELLGMTERFTRAHHDAIGLCLLSKSFLWCQYQRYKDGTKVPMIPKRIHLSSTFMKELIMSIDAAQAHAVTACEKAVTNATHAGHTDFAAAITALGEAGAAGIAAGKGSDLKAQGAAVAAIFNALDAVQTEGLKVPKTEAVHHDVVNLFNAMENVSNAIAASNRARLNAALGK